MPDLLVFLSIFDFAKDLLMTGLAVLNGVLALIATIMIWKSYLLTGFKVAMTALVVVPIIGVVAYWVWGRKKVEKAS